VYAREKVRPKLYDLDSEKLSRLFADLRRESVATGSFPITVRHLESMIRMAEASARMSLREYVRADDIDLAISVAVESFVNAQKMSIKKTLQRVRAPSPIQDHLFARKVTESFINLPFPIGLPQVCHTGARS
jgi:DNA replication licensing factor MCM2